MTGCCISNHAGVAAETGGSGVGISTATVCAVRDMDIATELEVGDTVDGYTLASGDTIALPTQTDQTENGLYQAALSGAASRATGWSNPADFQGGRRVYVENGDYYHDSIWELRTHRPSVGVDDISLLQVDRLGTDPSWEYNYRADLSQFSEQAFSAGTTAWAYLVGGGGACAPDWTHASDGIHDGAIELLLNQPNSYATVHNSERIWAASSPGGPMIVGGLVFICDLCDPAEDYTLRFGFGDSPNLDYTNGLYIELRLQAGTAQWFARAASGGVRSEALMANAVVGWRHLEIRWDEGATAVEYFLDRANRQVLTTNIPRDVAYMNWQLQFVKTAGVGERLTFIDYIHFLRRHGHLK